MVDLASSVGLGWAISALDRGVGSAVSVLADSGASVRRTDVVVVGDCIAGESGDCVVSILEGRPMTPSLVASTPVDVVDCRMVARSIEAVLVLGPVVRFL